MSVIAQCSWPPFTRGTRITDAKQTISSINGEILWSAMFPRELDPSLCLPALSLCRPVYWPRIFVFLPFSDLATPFKQPTKTATRQPSQTKPDESCLVVLSSVSGPLHFCFWQIADIRHRESGYDSCARNCPLRGCRTSTKSTPATPGVSAFPQHRLRVNP